MSFLQVNETCPVIKIGEKGYVGYHLGPVGSRVGGGSSDSQDHRLSWGVL